MLAQMLIVFIAKMTLCHLKFRSGWGPTAPRDMPRFALEPCTITCALEPCTITCK